MEKNNLLSYKTLFVFCFIAVLNISCDVFYTKETYFKDFEQFVTSTENNFGEYNDIDWENSDIEYKQYTEELYQKVYSDFNENDQRQIGKLKARYEKVKFKYELKNSIQSIKDGAQQVIGAFEEVIDSTIYK
jgi:hypothetical protein